MAKKMITIDDLAVMVKRGFDEVTDKMAKKIEVDRQFFEVNERFDRIEKLILVDHKRRIERLFGRTGERLARVIRN
mgnify:CR=1 FL=1